MDDRLTDLVALLRERFAPDTRVDEVEAFLSSEGYDRGQIGEIVALYFADRDDWPRGTRQLIHSQMTFRVMGPHERGRFAPEAWGHLLSLNGSGILNAAELEHVIERAMQNIDGRIALDDLRAMLEGSGVDEAGGGPNDNVTVH